MTEASFKKELENLDIKINKIQEEQLLIFFNFLIKKNQEFNLTTITDKKEVYLKHFYDSLTVVKGINLNKIESLCDLGSGAGFPGVVLKIFFPHLKVTLIDASNKKINYLKELINLLNLKNIEAIHARMEDYSKNHPEKYDLITVRAVGDLSVVLELSVKALKINSKIVFYKGNLDKVKMVNSNLLKELSLKQLDSILFSLPIENSDRVLIIFEKIAKTKAKYPRMMAKIKKEAL